MWNTAASILCSSSSLACSSSLSSSSRTAANILIRAHSNIQRQNYSCSRHSKAKANPHYNCHYTRSLPQSQISIAILASIAVSTGVCVVSDNSRATLADDSSSGAGADSSTTTKKKSNNNKTSSSSQFRSRKLTTVIHPKKKYGSFAAGGDKVKKKKKGTENAQLVASVARQKIIYPTELEYVTTDDNDDDNINSGFNRIKKKSLKSIEEEDIEVTASVEDLMIGSHTCHGIEPSSYHHLIDPITETLNLFTSKINQDRGCVVLNYCPMSGGVSVNHHLFAVFDGHGDGGEFISEFVMNELIRLLGKHPDFESAPKKALIETFLQIEDNIENDPFLEALYCGTTACVVLVRQNVLYIANIGDSRAILSRRMRRNKHPSTTRQTIELTQDQKPNLQSEKERIENEYGGYVSPGNSNTGIPARVWSSVDKRDLGLAMSRSLGDLSLKKSGVIATPVVSSYELHGDEEFIVIASDGLWEYMDSEEVVDLVVAASTSEDDTSVSFSSSCCNAKKASEALIKESAKRWRYYDGNYRDDITAIVIRLDKLRDEQEENEKKKKANE
eukprot:CAMPEP_0178946810 /NCGR_PEP_ID=MMETSP0789-20121207/4490_1 /TAXON_ID=3005 /ORGANISM="Rhizosolenia setigera, Strain CCMP 1694" /LENGTH=558 /DNA_ID=CAMNT_0020626839 /DNA_START=189 /DNA_END=1865 /DNA_ORIENTATION=-